MVNRIVIFITVVLVSCATYRRTTDIGTYVNKRGVKYHVTRTDVYDRKTRSLISSKIDTTEYEYSFDTYIP